MQTNDAEHVGGRCRRRCRCNIQCQQDVRWQPCTLHSIRRLRFEWLQQHRGAASIGLSCLAVSTGHPSQPDDAEDYCWISRCDRGLCDGSCSSCFYCCRFDRRRSDVDGIYERGLRRLGAVILQVVLGHAMRSEPLERTVFGYPPPCGNWRRSEISP